MCRLFESGQGDFIEFTVSFACTRDRYLIEKETAIRYSSGSA